MTNIEIDKLLAQAAANNDRESFVEAEQLCRKVLEMPEGLQKSGDTENLSKLLSLPATLQNAVALRLLSESLWRRGLALQALTIAEAGLAIALELENQPEKATSLSNVGIVYEHLSDNAHALEHFEKALAIEEALGNKNGIANNCGYIGSAFSSMSEYPRALENLQKALDFEEEQGNENAVAAYLHNIGMVHTNLTDYPRALEYFGKALVINEKNGNNVWKANNLGHIGNIYWRLLEFSTALQNHFQSLAIHEKIGTKRGIASSFGDIGNVYLSMLDYSHAMECYQKTLALAEELGFKNGIAASRANIGIVYKDTKDYPRALEYLQQALAMAEELGVNELVAGILGNIGEIYAEKKFIGYDAEKAEENLIKSITQLEELGATYDLPEYYSALAELYRQEKQWEEADKQFQKYHKVYLELHSEESKKTTQKFTYDRQAAEREKEIAVANAAAEAEINTTTTLLHKVLPPSIASRLMKGEKIADYFENVSILFADIVGFTPIAAQMPARKVLAFLNYVFGEFDRIIEYHGCEKIKTIGDGYMAVAGAPIISEDHAERIARAAVEMMGDIQLPEDIRSSLPKGAIFNIRIGIHIGPAFGGIVGEKRFVYDIYSDAVNTAARMESHGEPGRIHVSEEFAFHLQNRMDMTGDDLGGIVFEERDEIEIKGKGMMKTYFLEAKP